MGEFIEAEDDYDGEGDGEVEEAFEDAVEGVFEGLLVEGDDICAIVHGGDGGVVELFGKVIYDEQAQAALLADGDEVFGERVAGAFVQYDLGNVGTVGECGDVLDLAEDGDGALRRFGGCIRADEADDADAEGGFACDPALELGEARGRADEEGGALSGASEK